MKWKMKKKLSDKFPRNWQWKSNARGNMLLILLAIAHFGRKYRSQINYTGNATDLSRLTGLTSRTAQRSIRELIKQGIVEKTNDNMSLGNTMFSVQPATICRSVKKISDNMSAKVISPNDIDIDINIYKNINSNPSNIYTWQKDFNNFSFNEEDLTQKNIQFIKTSFENVNIDVEIQKFIDYWESKPKPKTWSGYRRLLTWLQKADKNERTTSIRFSKGRSTEVRKQIDQDTKRIAEQQRQIYEKHSI